jgi:hypothetical protein
MPRTAGGNDDNAQRKPRVNEEPSSELDLGTDEGAGRVGDWRSRKKLHDEFPPARVREAGQTGGEVPGGPHDERDVTADDLSPETLLDEERSHTPSALARRDAQDSRLHSVSEADIGEGGGLDEAELADRKPVGRDEARRLQRKIAEHAGNPNAFEPNESAEVAARLHSDARKRGGKQTAAQPPPLKQRKQAKAGD